MVHFRRPWNARPLARCSQAKHQPEAVFQKASRSPIQGRIRVCPASNPLETFNMGKHMVADGQRDCQKLGSFTTESKSCDYQLRKYKRGVLEVCCGWRERCCDMSPAPCNFYNQTIAGPSWQQTALKSSTTEFRCQSPACQCSVQSNSERSRLPIDRHSLELGPLHEQN